jgi:hypothetical protein
MRDSYSPIDRMVDAQRDAAKAAAELHQKEREVLFESEALVIRVLQAVSGASVVAVLAQFQQLIALAGEVPVKILITAMALSLAASVFAAYLKHQYKMWQVKGNATERGEEANKLMRKSGRDLDRMRLAMQFSLAAIGVGLAVFIVALWMK